MAVIPDGGGARECLLGAVVTLAQALMREFPDPAYVSYFGPADSGATKTFRRPGALERYRERELTYFHATNGEPDLIAPTLAEGAARAWSLLLEATPGKRQSEWVLSAAVPHVCSDAIEEWSAEVERALPGEYWLILQRVTWGHHFHPTDSQTAQQAGLHIGNDFLTIIPELGVFNHLTGAQVEWARRRGLSWAGECRPSRSGVGFEFEFGGMAQVQAARRELVDSYRADPVQREGSGSRPSSGPVAPVAPPVPRPPVVATQWVWAAGVGGWTASGASYPGRDELLLARVGNEVVALVFWDVAGGLQVAPLGGTPAREFGDTRIQIPDRDGLAGELAGWAWRILGRRVDEGRIAPVIADDVHDDVAPLSAAVAVVLDELGLPDPLRA